VEAYKRGGGKANKNENSTNASASDILNNSNVVAFVESFNVKKISDKIMDRDEMLERLTIMARTEVSDVVHIVTEDRQLMDMETGEMINGQTFWSLKSPEQMTNGGMKAISELTATNNGLKIKMHNQRGAMKQLAELQGFDAAKEVNVTVTKTLDDFYND
jgi:phage terminase small subunit